MKSKKHLSALELLQLIPDITITSDDIPELIYNENWYHLNKTIRKTSLRI